MAQHTPGPWVVTNRYIGTEGIFSKHIATAEKEDVGHPEAITNARLIAAAPDLLEACQLLVDYITDPRLAFSALSAKGIAIAAQPLPGPDDIVKIALTAIRKARGEDA